MGLFFSGSFFSHSSVVVVSSFPPSEHFVTTRLVVLCVLDVEHDNNKDNVWGQWLNIEGQQGLETLEVQDDDEECFVVLINGDAQIADILQDLV